MRQRHPPHLDPGRSAQRPEEAPPWPGAAQGTACRTQSQARGRPSPYLGVPQGCSTCEVSEKATARKRGLQPPSTRKQTKASCRGVAAVAPAASKPVSARTPHQVPARPRQRPDGCGRRSAHVASAFFPREAGVERDGAPPSSFPPLHAPASPKAPAQPFLGVSEPLAAVQGTRGLFCWDGNVG